MKGTNTMNNGFNGLGLHLGNLSRLSPAETRSISAENPSGAKGQGGRHVDPSHGASRDLGTGWKVRPCVGVQPGETLVLADVAGPGAIQQIWMTPTGNYRFSILRFYWDGEASPSVEVPIGDFFASAYTSFNTFRPIDSLPVCVIMDPVRFKQDLGVTIQSLGWRAGGRYLPNQDDMASTAFWYQAEPHAPFPALPNRDGLEII